MVDQCAAAAAEIGSAEQAVTSDVQVARKYLYEKLAPVVRNDMTLGASVAEAYWDPMTEDDRILDCEIVAFAASAATDIDSGEAAVKGWEETTSGKFQLNTIDASHDGILRDPELMRIINGHLSSTGI